MKKFALGMVIFLYGINALLVWISIGNEGAESTTSWGTAIATLLFAAANTWAFWYLYSYANRDIWIPGIVTVAMAIVALMAIVGVGETSVTADTTVGSALISTLIAGAVIAGALRLYTNRRYYYG